MKRVVAPSTAPFRIIGGPFSVAIAFRPASTVTMPAVLALTTRASICSACSKVGLSSAAQVADVVVVVHEHVGADLQLGEDAELGVDVDACRCPSR